MSELKNLITAEGKKALEAELEDLKVNQRKEIAQKIKEAREQGDLSENAEYDAAKNRQREIEARIEEIEQTLKVSEVVSEEDIDVSKVYVGCQVTVFDLDEEIEEVFRIVGTSESDSLIGKISNESPVGQALLGASVGDVVDVEAPMGVIQYKVMDIQKASAEL